LAALMLRMRLITAIAIAIPSIVLAQQAVPVDPLTGMQIPVLPGQFYVKSPRGCWMITDEALRYALKSYQFIGSCKFGVVDGPGLQTRIQDPSHPQPLNSWDYRPIRAKLGELRLGYPPKSDLYAPLTSTHDALEIMTLQRTLDPASKLFEHKYEEAGEVLVTYEAWKNRVQTLQSLQIHKNLCPSLGYDGRSYLSKGDLQYRMKDTMWATKDQFDKIVDFCWGEMARLKKESGGKQLTFENLDYGYYFLTWLVTDHYTFAADGSDTIAQQRSGVSDFCPSPGTLTGCESVWQGMLAPFVSKFQTLKPQESALWAQHRAEQKARFAPLAAAWRAKIEALNATPSKPVGAAATSTTP